VFATRCHPCRFSILDPPMTPVGVRAYSIGWGYCAEFFVSTIEQVGQSLNHMCSEIEQWVHNT
jgi:hypothetical protein